MVAHADLPEVDPGAEERREVPYERAEVDPLLGREVDGELVPVPLPLGVAHLHDQIVAADPLDHLAPGVFLGAAVFVVPPPAVPRGPPGGRAWGPPVRPPGGSAPAPARAAPPPLLFPPGP